MKLEEGMYVRTEKGNISKIKFITHVVFFKNEIKSATICLENGETIRMYYGDIIKSSHNIIDLIEVGDYVNGVMVESMNNSIKPIPIPQYKNECGEYIDFDESDIKSIVTKEQFSAMEYRLGDK